MFGRILGATVGGGLLELFLLIAAGSRFGALPVFAVVILTGVAGVMIVRHYGLKSLATLQAELQGSTTAEQAISKGVAGAIAGILLILPGLIGDALGILLLLPPIQTWLLRRLPKANGPAGGSYRERVIVIEGKAYEIEEEPPGEDAPPSRNSLR